MAEALTALGLLRTDAEARIAATRPRTITFLSRANRAAPTRPLQPIVERGAGAHVIDVDGHRLLDCVNSMSALVLGHAHPAIATAIEGQLRFGTTFAHPHPAQIDLLEELRSRIRSADRVVLLNSGTEAVLLALRLMRARTGRRRVVVLEDGFHGHIAELAFAPSLQRQGDVIRVPLDDEHALRQAFSSEPVAGVLLEPVLNRAGQVPVSDTFLRTARDVTGSFGALLALDEVATFRHARGGAQERLRIEPDLTVLGKVIGGGLPVGAVAGTDDAMSVLAPGALGGFETGGTFSGNPLTAVAGLATLRELTPEAHEHLDALGLDFRRALDRSPIADGLRFAVTGMGSLLNLHLERAVASGWRRVAARTEEPVLYALALKMWEIGVLTTHRGTYALSTAMSNADVDDVVAAVQQAAAWLSPATEEHLCA